MERSATMAIGPVLCLVLQERLNLLSQCQSILKHLYPSDLLFDPESRKVREKNVLFSGPY